MLIDGQPARSCITPIGTRRAKAVTTIEGLEQDGKLHPVQQAFLDPDALQCGYCTSGMIMSAVGLLHKTPNPSEQDILSGMNGNVCRCGTYRRIVRCHPCRRADAEGGATMTLAQQKRGQEGSTPYRSLPIQNHRGFSS